MRVTANYSRMCRIGVTRSDRIASAPDGRTEGQGDRI